MVQHVFTDWLDVLMDRAAPLAISGTPPIEGVSGSCFAVESSTVSLVVPLDTGIYCYDEEGVLTGARLSFGTLILVSGDTTGPDSIQLPGPVVEALRYPPRRRAHRRRIPPALRPEYHLGSPPPGGTLTPVMWQALLLRRRGEAR